MKELHESWSAAGEGPAVVLLLGGESAAADRSVTELARQLRVVVPDGGSADEVLREVVERGLKLAAIVASPQAAEEAIRAAAVHPGALEALVLDTPPPPPSPEVLAEVTTPTLVVCGGDAPSPAAYRRAMPNCTLMFVDGAANAVADEQPETFAELVAEFVRAREAIVVPA